MVGYSGCQKDLQGCLFDLADDGAIIIKGVNPPWIGLACGFSLTDTFWDVVISRSPDWIRVPTDIKGRYLKNAKIL